ncbi:MAG: DNA repair protein RadC [Vicinamibacterales bacterium]
MNASRRPSGPRSLAELAPDERPRERLRRVGASGLGDHELVAVVLGSGIRGRDSLAVARQLLRDAGGLPGLAAWPPPRLMRAVGIGPGRAARLAAAVELGRRAVAGPRRERPRIASPAAAAEHLLPRLGGRREEHFGVLLLDTRHRLIHEVVVSVGSLDASLVHPREVFRAASEHSAAALVLFHNHPSGDPTPSADDLVLTRRLVQAGELMGIGVVDHVVVGDGCWHSLRESSPAVFAR